MIRLRPGERAILTELLVVDEKVILAMPLRLRQRPPSLLRSRLPSALRVERELDCGTT
ncbi:MAG: hypothetical protein O7A63_03880 [Acidobacteria bacterium]|nr:hypothetical protein [Acidobacteriota bacterium]